MHLSPKVWNLLRWGCIAYFAMLLVAVIDDVSIGYFSALAGLHCDGGCFRFWSNRFGDYIVSSFRPPSVPGLPLEKVDGGWYVRAFFLGVFIAWFRFIDETRPPSGQEKTEGT